MSDALDKLNEAVAEFAQSQSEEIVMVSIAVVCWEEVSYDSNGRVQRQIKYSIPTDNFSMSSAIGLMSLTSQYMKADLRGSHEDD